VTSIRPDSLRGAAPAPSAAPIVAAPTEGGSTPDDAGIHGLEPLLRPKSVAVIGASRERGTIGAEIFHNLLAHEFQGAVYPVNPKADVVQSVRAYPSIEEVPGPVDLAVVVVPNRSALDVLEACGRAGVRAAVVISAGFKETGPEGAEREKALLECARRFDMRLVGPNCLGVLNTEDGVRLDATFAPVYPPAGRVAFSSQSGALGLAILEYATELNLGISHFVSVGNKADVSGNDLIEFWEKDSGTDLVLLYLESFGNPRRFTQIARRVGRTKPIVAVKSGRTQAGVRAAASHTGSLAGSDAAVDALCLQSGVIRTDTIEELFDVAILLAHQPIPRGNRVAIVTNAGGPGIMATDACESHGLELPALADETVTALRSFLAREASTKNPVDMIASASVESFEKGVRLVANDPNVDSVLVIYVPPIVTRPLDVAQAIVRGVAGAASDAAARGEGPKPVLTCFLGSHGVPEGLRSLHEGQIPSYAFPEAAAIALARAVRYGRWRAEPEGEVRRFADVDAERARRALAAVSRRAAAGGTTWLEPAEVQELLAAYGLRTPPSVVARDAAQAVSAAARVGYPVVLKLVSESITHKSDVGGVVLDLRDEAEVRGAFAAIGERLAARGLRDRMDGVLVQPMLREGSEAIVGMTHDPSFGPLLMFGLGGVNVELLKDVAFRVQPLTDRDARELVRAVRGFPLLEGWRGAPAGDVAAVEETLLRVSQLAGDHPEIVEMDLNPVKVLEPGRGCVVLDARVAVRRV
jgi:acetyl coenzyme A synthetase (ADP forming)-like protein